MRSHLLPLTVLPMLAAQAQAPRALPGIAHPHARVTALKEHPQPPGAQKALSIVFNEDFANGLTGNSGFGPWTTSGVDGAIWQYDTNGPNGDFSDPATEKIASTTVNNGFMIFDSNLSNNGGVTTNRVGYLVSPVLDLSATPDVQLRFEERFRWCCSAAPGHWVDVSVDGGASWPFRVNVGDGAVNQPSAVNVDIGTHVKWIDISSFIAGAPATVAFRFGHDDTDGTPNISHYHWQIDDVQLIATPSYDPQFLATKYDDFLPDLLVLSGATADLEYTMYPFSQLHALTLKGLFRNGGTADLPVVSYTVTVDDPSATEIFDQTFTIPDLVRYELDSFSFGGFTPPADTGTYTVDFTLAADSVDEHPQDNTFSRTFAVSEFTYALDDDVMNGRSNTQGGDEFELCNKFFIHAEADAYAIQVGFATKPGNSFLTPHDELVVGNVYDGAGNWIAQTNEYIIDSLDLIGGGENDLVTLLFDDPLTMPVDEYLVCTHYLGGDPIWIACSGLSEPGTSLDARPNVQDAAAQFFIQDNTPMIRLNFDPTIGNIGMDEQDRANGVGLGQNVPNPASWTTAIPYILERPANVRLTVHDLGGKLILEQNEGGKGAGQHRIRLETTTMPEGVYFYTLTADDTRLSKRMTVMR